MKRGRRSEEVCVNTHACVIIVNGAESFPLFMVVGAV